MYLNGGLGNNPEDLNPYLCSTLYAVDRAAQFIKNYNKVYRQPDGIIVADRYISANIIHQGGKIGDVSRKRDFIKWAYEFETKLLGVPKEDITIFLDVPPRKSQELLDVRYSGDNSKKDIHEGDLEYLQLCYNGINDVLEIVNELDYNWVRVNCLDGNGAMRSIEDIHLEIVGIVKEHLKI